MAVEFEGLRLKEQGLRYIHGRHQIVTEYLETCQKLKKAVSEFDEYLGSQNENQQPAFLLRNLLETCERSLCQDTRDKVYGLLGLASDIKVDDLRVDYSKSMFELFWDVVWLTYKQNDGSNSDNVGFGIWPQAELIRLSQLVQRSLGGPFPGKKDFQEQTNHAEPVPQSLVQLPGFVTGTVLVLDRGNTSLSLYQDEEEILKPYISGQAGQSSTADMVTALDQLRDVNVDVLQPFTPNRSYGSTSLGDAYCFPQQIGRRTRPKSAKPMPVLFVEGSGLIGLASGNIRSDDLLVQFSKCDIAAIVRPCGENKTDFMLVGRAVVARRFGEERKTVSDSSTELFKYTIPTPASLIAGQVIWFWVDAITVQDLTCPASEKREYSFDTLAN